MNSFTAANSGKPDPLVAPKFNTFDRSGMTPEDTWFSWVNAVTHGSYLDAGRRETATRLDHSSLSTATYERSYCLNREKVSTLNGWLENSIWLLSL